MQLRDKVVVVTGASSGIGAAVVQTLAGRGARVVLAARREGALAQVHARAGLGDRGLVVATDVGRHDELERLTTATLERFGHADAVVHVAGLGTLGRLDTQPPERIETVVRVNLLAPLWLTRLLLPSLRTRPEATVVLVSSMSALMPLPLQTAYAAAKAGLTGAAHGLRRELAGTGVRVLEVYPGLVDTPMLAPMKPVAKAHGLRLPIQRPEAVAEKIVRAMERRRRVLLTGLTDRIIAAFARRLPRLTDRLLARTVPMLEDAAAAEKAALPPPS